MHLNPRNIYIYSCFEAGVKEEQDYFDYTKFECSPTDTHKIHELKKLLTGKKSSASLQEAHGIFSSNINVRAHIDMLLLYYTKEEIRNVTGFSSSLLSTYTAYFFNPVEIKKEPGKTLFLNSFYKEQKGISDLFQIYINQPIHYVDFVMNLNTSKPDPEKIYQDMLYQESTQYKLMANHLNESILKKKAIDSNLYRQFSDNRRNAISLLNMYYSNYDKFKDEETSAKRIALAIENVPPEKYILNLTRENELDINSQLNEISTVKSDDSVLENEQKKNDKVDKVEKKKNVSISLTDIQENIT